MREFAHYSQGDWFLLALLFIGACICLFTALRMFHRARLIEDTPTSKIRSCPQGYAELYGTAKWMQGPEIHAPLSGLPCVWYSFVVEEHAPHSKQKWRRIESGISDHLFLLEDETGTCVIDPNGADVTPSSSSTWLGSQRINPKNNNPSTLKILGDVLMSRGSKYRYTERRLDVYESVYAIGEFASLGTDYRREIENSIRTYLSNLKRNKDEMSSYDKNKDGQIDQDEWEEARKDAKQAAFEKQLANPLPKRIHILRKPQSKKYQPFILSSKSETQISRRNRIYSASLAGLFIILVTSIFLKVTGMY